MTHDFLTYFTIDRTRDHINELNPLHTIFLYTFTMNYVENYVPGKSAANYLSEHYIKAKQSVSNLPNETKTQLLEHTLKPIERVLTLKLGPAGKFVHGQVVKKVGNRIESGKLFKSPGINAGSAGQKTELHAFCTQVKTSNKPARDFWNDVKHEDSVKEVCAFFDGL